ncbi:MAG: hypothetical protein AB9835_01235 [Eubacteriales bacterium]
MKRILSAFIITALLFSLLSCADTKTPAVADTTSEVTTQQSTTREMPDLPETDMNGKTFTFLTSGWGEEVWVMNDIMAESETGEAINDAKYLRNRTIESRYNCKIAEFNTMLSDAPAKLRTNVKAGDTTYDFFMARPQQYLPLAQDGMIIDLNTVPHLDFSRPWWDHNAVESLSVLDKLYAVTSDITIMDNDATSALVFNKKIVEDYDLQSPYELVTSGNWTLETMGQMVKEVSKDINGDGKMDKDDMYGFLYQRDTLTAFLAGAGEMVGRKDENDIPYITLTNERSVTVMQDVLSLLYNKDTCFNVMIYFTGDFNPPMTEMFIGDRALFMWIRMVNVVALRAMETDFGILPTPKYNSTQENYLSAVNPWTAVTLTVPATNADLENSGIFLGGLCR